MNNIVDYLAAKSLLLSIPLPNMCLTYWCRLMRKFLISSSLLSFTACNAVADKYVPVRYKFEPLPKYDELRKPRKGRGTYQKDPNVWVYTRAFAERFGMPERWIDESLEGAEAVAYRVEQSQVQTCGYFGEEENCRPRLSCVFDVYLTDQDSARLPWESHKLSDWGTKSSSMGMLSFQSEEDYWYWTDETKNKRYKYKGPTGLRSVVFVEGPPSRRHGYDRVYSGQGPMDMRSYRRDFFKGLDLLELNGCMTVSANKPVRMYFLDPQPSMNDPRYRLPDGSINRAKLDAADKKQSINMISGNPPHKVRLPDAYMERVQAHDKAERQQRSLAAEAWRRFKGSESEQAYHEARKSGLWERFVRWVIE